MYSVEKKINDLKINIPDIAVPIANYLPYKIHNKTVFISGQGPIKDGKVIYLGKVGKECSLEEGIEAAKLSCINVLAALKYSIGGDWTKVQGIVKIGGFVNCIDNFTDHPKIINGASNLLVEIFGDIGKHSRFAIGCNSLPLNMAVEIEAIVSLY